MKKKVAFYLCEKNKFPNLKALNHRLNAVFNGKNTPVMLEVDLDPNFDHLVIAFCSETIEKILVELICKKHIDNDGFFWMDRGPNDTPRVLTYDVD
jgi:hypothetical protein